MTSGMTDSNDRAGGESGLNPSLVSQNLQSVPQRVCLPKIPIYELL